MKEFTDKRHIVKGNCHKYHFACLRSFATQNLKTCRNRLYCPVKGCWKTLAATAVEESISGTDELYTYQYCRFLNNKYKDYKLICCYCTKCKIISLKTKSRSSNCICGEKLINFQELLEEIYEPRSSKVRKNAKPENIQLFQEINHKMISLFKPCGVCKGSRNTLKQSNTAPCTCKK